MAAGWAPKIPPSPRFLGDGNGLNAPKFRGHQGVLFTLRGSDRTGREASNEPLHVVGNQKLQLQARGAWFLTSKNETALLLRCGFRTDKLVTITQAMVVAKFTRSTASGSDGRLHYGYTLPQHRFRDGRIQPLRHASSALGPQQRLRPDSDSDTDPGSASNAGADRAKINETLVRNRDHETGTSRTYERIERAGDGAYNLTKGLPVESNG